MDWGRMFFSAYGRIRRQEFWITFLVLFGAMALIGWILPIFPVVLYCSVCTRTKRLHDMGRTGWFQIIPAVAYSVAMFVTMYFIVGVVITGVNFDELNEAVAASGIIFGALTLGVTWLLAFLVDFAFLLWIGCAEGEIGDNRFGPEPATLGETHVARA